MKKVHHLYSKITKSLALAGVALLLGAGAPLPDPALSTELLAAAREIGYFDYRSAEPHFEKAIALAKPDSDDWATALYGKATCLYHMTPVSVDNVAQATALFTQTWKARPDSRAGRLAALALGRIAELRDFLTDSADLPLARTWYQAVIDKAPDSPEADLAALRLAGTYIQTYDKAQCLQGIEILQKWLASHPPDKNPLAAGMHLYIADTYFYPLGNDKAALDNYLKADAIGLPPTGKESTLYWRMATLADTRLNDPKTAIACYEKILKITPTSGKSFEAQLALTRLRSVLPPLPKGEGRGEGALPPSTSSTPTTSSSSTRDTGRGTRDSSPPSPEAKP
jgi:tetratricopeptide (TPR) repeat protein